MKMERLYITMHLLLKFRLKRGDSHSLGIYDLQLATVENTEIIKTIYIYIYIYFLTFKHVAIQTSRNRLFDCRFFSAAHKTNKLGGL
jgi:hypothetical protein